MKTKEKALELVSKYRDLTEECNCLEYSCVCFTMFDFKAKQCALIAVNLVLSTDLYSMDRDFWINVYEEIEKL
jgi:hypothetical protein